MGVLPDEEIKIMTEEYGLTIKDAMSLISLNEGGRVEYFRNVVDEVLSMDGNQDQKHVGRLVGNWVLHEMGGLTHVDADEENPLRMTAEGDCVIDYKNLASLIHYLDTNKITGKSAKRVLAKLFEQGLSGMENTTKEVIEEAGLWFHPLSNEQYEELARSVLDMKVVEQILAGKDGKINFLVGQMMRKDGDGKVDPQVATAVLRRLIEEHRK
ncbi:hypothetical protein G7Y89_g14055 [Cudoniella acicularis]|uniref:Asn/Gln amidotransferase domain-containing protein n=1 Tax=Cudoniella acicularis TaxID=354080 RepID=A0A8H4R8I1_9HELO|nr:hypothetical protein G7Y89_g14055 [Cudoniella acicularis]